MVNTIDRASDRRTGLWRGRAMGTTVDLQVSGPAGLGQRALRRVDELENRWSRFIAESDISRSNAARGAPVIVHADTRTLVRHGIRAWQLTGGAFDPTVLDAVIAAGYDRPFDELDAATAAAYLPERRTPGCADMRVDDELCSITFPPGVGFDPGAIGKGLAADMIVNELRYAGASGAFLSIGGDIRVDGDPPIGDGWLIEIREPTVRAGIIGRVSMTGGGLATSTSRRRRWTTNGERRHHIIDPETGRCSRGAAVLVTAIAGEAWWAEALATQLMLSEPHDWSKVVGDDGALIVDDSGQIQVFGRMKDHLR